MPQLGSRRIRFGVPLIAAAILAGFPFLLSHTNRVGPGTLDDIVGILLIPGFMLAGFIVWGGVHGEHPSAYIVAMVILNFAVWYLISFWILGLAMNFRRGRRMY